LWGISCLMLIWRRNRTGFGHQRRLLIAIVVTSGLGFFMTSRMSYFLWRSIAQLKYLQVTSRWLAVATAGTCVLAAAAALSGSGKKRFVPACLLAPIIILNLAISYHISTQHAIDRRTLDANVSQRDFEEFFPPKWWNQGYDYKSEQAGYPLGAPECTLALIDDRGLDKRYIVRSGAQCDLNMKPLYFPGWTASIDGQQIQVQPGEGGHIQLTVPGGEHEVDLRFRDTPVRLAGKATSALSLAVVTFIAWSLRRQRKRCENVKGTTIN